MMLRNILKKIAFILLVLVNLNSYADECLSRSDSDYQRGLVGQWIMTDGPDYEEINQLCLDSKLVFADGNRVEIIMVNSEDSSKVPYLAKGFYYVYDGSLVLNLQYESDINVGLVDNNQVYKLVCLGSDMFTLSLKNSNITYQRVE